MTKRWLALGSLALGVGLIAVVFLFFDLNIGDLGQMLARVPWWVYPVLAVTNGATIVAGSAKWLMTLQALTGERPRIGRSASVMATSTGVFFGQVLPIQLATAAARTVLGRIAEVPPARAIGSTLFEQLIDLLVLAVMAFAALVYVVMDLPGWQFAMLPLVLCGILAIAGQPVIRLLGRFVGALAQRLPGRVSDIATRLAEALNHPGMTDGGFIARMIGLSVLRYGLMVGGAILIVRSMIPADPATVAAIFPTVQIATVLPITPAGLGVAEWTWTGVFAAAGIAAQQAALAAIAIRIVNFGGFVIFHLGLTAFWMLRR